MSKTITLTYTIPEELYQIFEKMAARDGKTTEQVALEYLARRAPKPRRNLSAEALQAARERFERHFGTWESGDPNFADNEGIDADLAREYASTHEET